MSDELRTVWLLSPLAAPLVIAAAVMIRRTRRAALAVAPWAPLPALALAALGPTDAVDLPWLLLGGRFALDELGRTFLLFTALVWLCAGVYARGYVRERAPAFFVFHLAAMAGNLGMCVAGDVPSFYLSFVLMTLSAYGLVVHERSSEARRAGRVYIALAVLGEALLLSGVLLTMSAMEGTSLESAPAAIARAEHPGWIVALLFGGFGVKAAVLPVHVWLPLAHPVAPTPASATLSGAMIEAGLLGWLRMFPLGHLELGAWGAAVVALGLLAAFIGAFVGLTQRDPKTVLAYSSVSQMGLMTAAVGAGLAVPRHAGAALSAAALLAVHHGLAKTSLFLSVGVVERRLSSRARPWIAVGVALPILALAGAPLTSGAVAKAALGEALHGLPSPWEAALGVVVSLASVATLLVLLRFAFTLRARSGAVAERPARSLAFGWGASVAASAALIWLVPWLDAPLRAAEVLTVGALWKGTWPALLAVGLAALWLAAKKRRAAATSRVPSAPSIPPGDVVVLFEPAASLLRRGVVTLGAAIGRDAERSARPEQARAAALFRRLGGVFALEERLTPWTTGATLLVIAALALLVLLAT